MLMFLNKFSTKLCDPLFLESVFCQKLEKTGFSFVRDRESDETHSFRVALTYKLHNSFFLLIAQTRRVSTTTQHLEGLFSLISRSRTKLKPVFSSFWQKTDSKNRGSQSFVLNLFRNTSIFTRSLQEHLRSTECRILLRSLKNGPLKSVWYPNGTVTIN